MKTVYEQAVSWTDWDAVTWDFRPRTRMDDLVDVELDLSVLGRSRSKSPVWRWLRIVR